MQHLDVVILEEAIRVVRDRKASASVKVQALQMALAVGKTPGANEESETGPSLDVDEFLRDLRARVVRLQDHFGRSFAELIGDVTVDLSEPDVRVQ